MTDQEQMIENNLSLTKNVIFRSSKSTFDINRGEIEQKIQIVRYIKGPQNYNALSEK